MRIAHTVLPLIFSVTAVACGSSSGPSPTDQAQVAGEALLAHPDAARLQAHLAEFGCSSEGGAGIVTPLLHQTRLVQQALVCTGGDWSAYLIGVVRTSAAGPEVVSVSARLTPARHPADIEPQIFSLQGAEVVARVLPSKELESHSLGANVRASYERFMAENRRSALASVTP